MSLIVAASWTANFSSWSAFANWLNNSNFASMFLGIALPGALIAGWHLRRVRKLHDQSVEQIKQHVEQVHARYAQERREWEERLRERFPDADKPAEQRQGMTGQGMTGQGMTRPTNE